MPIKQLINFFYALLTICPLVLYPELCLGMEIVPTKKQNYVQPLDSLKKLAETAKTNLLSMSNCYEDTADEIAIIKYIEQSLTHKKSTKYLKQQKEIITTAVGSAARRIFIEKFNGFAYAKKIIEGSLSDYSAGHKQQAESSLHSFMKFMQSSIHHVELPPEMQGSAIDYFSKYTPVINNKFWNKEPITGEELNIYYYSLEEIAQKVQEKENVAVNAAVLKQQREDAFIAQSIEQFMHEYNTFNETIENWNTDKEGSLNILLDAVRTMRKLVKNATLTEGNRTSLLDIIAKDLSLNSTDAQLNASQKIVDAIAQEMQKKATISMQNSTLSINNQLSHHLFTKTNIQQITEEHYEELLQKELQGQQEVQELLRYLDDLFNELNKDYEDIFNKLYIANLKQVNKKAEQMLREQQISKELLLAWERRTDRCIEELLQEKIKLEQKLEHYQQSKDKDIQEIRNKIDAEWNRKYTKLDIIKQLDDHTFRSKMEDRKISLFWALFRIETEYSVNLSFMTVDEETKSKKKQEYIQRLHTLEASLASAKKDIALEAWHENIKNITQSLKLLIKPSIHYINKQQKIIDTMIKNKSTSKLAANVEYDPPKNNHKKAAERAAQELWNHMTGKHTEEVIQPSTPTKYLVLRYLFVLSAIIIMYYCRHTSFALIGSIVT